VFIKIGRQVRVISLYIVFNDAIAQPALLVKIDPVNGNKNNAQQAPQIELVANIKGI
jgi:hypothetical protein